jgi:hypothetical protein
MNLFCGTIAYNKFSILEKSIINFIEKSKIKNKTHYVIDNNYPYGDSKKLEKLCNDFNIKYLNFNKNLGLFNSMYEIQNLCQEQDYIILHEGNNLILDDGFDEALIDAYNIFAYDHKDEIYYLCLENEFSNELQKLQKNNINYSIIQDKKLIGFPYSGTNICKKEKLKVFLSNYNNIYFDDPYLNSNIKKDAYILRDYKEISHYFLKEEDIEYKMYKMITVFLKYSKSFDEFLKLYNEKTEYVYMMINKIDKKVLNYIGYIPESPIIRNNHE